MTDYYNDVYLQKLNFHGSNLTEKALSRGMKEFNKYLDTTPTRHEIIKDNQEYYVSIQTSSQSAEGERYEKKILAKLEDNFKVGDIFQWNDENWMILTKEKLTVPTHFKGKIRHCNRVLKWQKNGVKHIMPAHVITSGNLALNDGSGSNIIHEEGGMIISAIVPADNKTATIKRYDRFIIKDSAWQVVGIDSVSVDNLLFIRLEENQINRATDDLNEGIADKYVPDDSGGHKQTESYEYTLEGKNKIIWNEQTSYIGMTDKEEISSQSFTIDDTELVEIVEIIEEENTVIVKANSSGTVGQTLLKWNVDGVEVEKTISVTSLWGE